MGILYSKGGEEWQCFILYLKYNLPNMKNPILFLMLSFCFSSIHAQVAFKGYDLNTTGNSDPKDFIVVNNTLFFSAQNGTNGTELWYFDGIMAAPAMLKDILPGSFSSSPSNFAALNGKLIFAADDGTNGRELWISDGTLGGTVMLKNIAPSGSSNPEAFCEMNGKLYFKADDGISGTALWVTDGTAVGTQLITPLDIYSVYTSSIKAFNNKLYFGADDGSSGIEPWISDGTAAGTHMLKDVQNFLSSHPNTFYPFNGKMYFAASSNEGYELWVTDGTTAGTNMITDFSPGWKDGIYIPYQFIIEYDNHLYYNGSNVARGLCVTDGTAAGTKKLHEISTTPLGLVVLRYPTIYMGKLYFMTETHVDGDLWVTDGTQAGTHVVKDIQPDTSYPTHMTVFKDKMYFAAYPSAGNYQLFRSDGTEPGTNMIQPASTNNNPLTGYMYFNGFIEFKGKLYFRANYTSTGDELWSIDDTTTSITSIQDATSFSIYPNPADGNFTIELNNNHFNNAGITIYDMMGRTIYQSTITNKLSSINLSNQPKGIYLVKLQVDNIVNTARLVIE